MHHSKPVNVKILNKEYQINCPEGLEKQLIAAADYLDTKMHEIRGSGRVIGIERISIMAALNIAHELLSFRNQKENYVKSVKEQIEHLQNKLDEALMDIQAEESA